VSLDNLLKDLQTEYINRLSEKATEIELAFKSKDISTVQDVFHRLKGSGSTYGIPEISDLGLVAEAICHHHPEALPWVVPAAIEILKKIQRSRQIDLSYPITEDPCYLRLVQAGQK
jgi:HPt (histidine-containing phosphotransfer) domain-containing protein